MTTSQVGKIEWVHVLRAALAWAVVYAIGAAIGLYVFLARELMHALAALGHPVEPRASELARVSVFGMIFILGLGVASSWLYAVVRVCYGTRSRTALRSGLFIWALCVAAPVSHLVVFRIISVRFAALDLLGECLLILVASVVGSRTYEWSVRSRPPNSP
ncbi:MAG TPA: hypothetical protein VI670_05060 [Thermoanaerobaculia bacterium]